MQPELIAKIKKRIRLKSNGSEEEIKDLVSAAAIELEKAGVYGNPEDPLYYQAVVLYCKANYGYDENTERFRKSFEALRDSMALSGDYEKQEDS